MDEMPSAAELRDEMRQTVRALEQRVAMLEGLVRDAWSAIDVICGPDEKGRDVVPNLWERINAALNPETLKGPR